VGDICNKPDTFPVKRRSPIRYYSFVEFFDFQQAHRTDELIRPYAETFEAADGHFSAVPHAPYSVSPGLFKQLREMNPPGRTISIHNQETPAEEVMFMHGAGPFREFYAGFGFPLDHFLPTGLSSLQSTIPHLNPDQRTLFVHNTLTTRDDIRIAHLWSDNVYWATCPNANLYIENRLPDYQAFIDTDARLTIGTDSLTSNWQLSILDEMKAIARYQSYVPFDTLLRWATLNGAEALGFAHDLGSIEAGKRPGILRLEYRPGEQALWDARVKVERVI
jgi:cytosine/adenosine deaminase-related metal-dependent hydrolase